ncbi:hypothetical protein [Iodobacter fluviatilis]|uniref:Uncharacterized protein n=1 Tax=Iodobacter fluviatilis TaxID=537 RepID=A0A7G3GBC4_9NEIS|nr:hypothetical protein [Iodobacter fluviatilis]QBC44434.1 hypothetical protein C1H71_13445 [Iodobacter fluviatilis]
MRDLIIVLVLFSLFVIAWMAICLILIKVPAPENSAFAVVVLLGIIYIFYGLSITFNPTDFEKQS